MGLLKKFWFLKEGPSLIKREKGFEVFIQSKHGLIGIIETNFDTTPNCETYC